MLKISRSSVLAEKGAFLGQRELHQTQLSSTCHETLICSWTPEEFYSSTLVFSSIQHGLKGPLLWFITKLTTPSLTAKSEGVTVNEAKGALGTVGTPWMSSQFVRQLLWPLKSVNLCSTEL